MKKNLFITAFLCLPLMLMAGKKTDDAKYLAGAVPEQEGIVTFQKSFSVDDKDTQTIYDILLKHVQDSLIGKALKDKEPVYTRLLASEREGDTGTIVARVDEYMVFQNTFLSLDRTRFRYLISAEVTGKKVKLTITQITYYYNEDMNGQNGVNYKAEEWITDKLAINKAGTKLYPRSGKFRRKTVDRTQAIFEGIMDAISDYQDKSNAEVKGKTRKGIVED